MRSKHHSRGRNIAVPVALAFTMLVGSLWADPMPANRARALTNWQAALTAYKKAGTLIGQDNYAQAKAELSAAATNLPTPYGPLATQFLDQLDSTLKQHADQKDPARLDELVQLCTDLRAYDAVVRLRARGEKGANAADDVASAWRLWESGDTKGALAEYKRKLAEESVDMWQDYYRTQIRLLEQRPTNLTSVPFAIELVQQHYLKGYEAKADLFAALQELTRVLPYARNPKEAVSVHQLIIKHLDSSGDETGRDAWEDKLLSDFKADPEACAGVYLERGTRAYAKKDFAAALPLFRKICSEFPDSGAYGDAQYDLGLVLQQQQKHDEAIAEFTKLISSKVEDYTLADPESSDDYKCYRFRAAMGISECYAAKKDFVRALENVELARDRYKFMSWCKTCLAEMNAKVQKRVADLEEAVKKGALPIP